MVSAEQMTKQNSATYAVARDFCRIFEQDMDRLYLFSFLLTADHAMAEKCFAGGLEDSAKNSRVFKEWAASWARRMIVRNAIQMVRPEPGNTQAIRGPDNAVRGPAEITSVAELPVFDRFVFVMSVLEGYSDQECGLLLDCTRREVIAARVHALQLIGSSAEVRWSATASVGSGEQVPQDAVGLSMKVDSVSYVATSA
jgi:DNA-directed RNA polymerase specialized sigma24 family protein